MSKKYHMKFIIPLRGKGELTETNLIKLSYNLQNKIHKENRINIMRKSTIALALLLIALIIILGRGF